MIFKAGVSLNWVVDISVKWRDAWVMASGVVLICRRLFAGICPCTLDLLKLALMASFGGCLGGNSVPQRLDRRRSQSKLIQDLRPVLQPAREGGPERFAVALLWHDKGIARHQFGTFQVVEPAAPAGVQHGAVGAHDEAVAHVRVGVDAGHVEVVTHLAPGAPEDGVVVGHGADGEDEGGAGGHAHAVTVLERQVGQVGRGGAGREFQGDAARGLQALESSDLGLAGLGLCHAELIGGLGVGGGQVGCCGGAFDGQLGFEALDGVVQGDLLLAAGFLAGELGAEDVGLGGHAAGTQEELGQGLTGQDLVDAGGGDFAFHAHQPGLLGHRVADVLSREDGDDVAGLQGEVVGRVVVDHGLAEVEGDQLHRERLGVDALDGGVFPVGLVDDVLHVAGELLGADVAAVGELHQLVLADVVVRGDEGVPVGDELADAHAGGVRVAQGGRDVAAQGDGVGELGRDAKEGDDVAVPEQRAPGLGQVQRGDGARRLGLGGVDAFELGRAGVGGGAGAAAVAKHALQGLALRLQFVDGWRVDRAQHRHAGASRGVDDDVPRQQPDVPVLVAVDDEVVEVQLGDDLAVTAQLDLAHAAVLGRAAAGEDGADQGRQAADGVVAWPARLPDDEDLDAAQLAQGDVEAEVPEHPAHLGAQVGFGVSGLDAGHAHGADAGDVDLPVAVDGGAVVDVDAAPGADVQLVARAEHVVDRHGDAVNGREAAVCPGKVGLAEQRQLLAGGVVDEALELVLLRRFAQYAAQCLAGAFGRPGLARAGRAGVARRVGDGDGASRRRAPARPLAHGAGRPHRRRRRSRPAGGARQANDGRRLGVRQLRGEQQENERAEEGRAHGYLGGAPFGDPELQSNPGVYGPREEGIAHVSIGCKLVLGSGPRAAVCRRSVGQRASSPCGGSDSMPGGALGAGRSANTSSAARVRPMLSSGRPGSPGPVSRSSQPSLARL